MAFTKAPTNDTYSSQTVSLVQDFRMAAGRIDLAWSDGGMINVIPHKHGEEVYGITRPGIIGTFITTDANANVRGMFVWEKQIGTTYYFVVTGDGVNTKVWSSPDLASWVNVDTFADTSRKPVRFCEFISATNVKSVVMVTGTIGMVYTSNAAGTQIVDADFPTPHVPFPVFLNGRVHLAKSNTGDIYCSDLNDPTAWTAGAFISSEVYADDIKALVKVDNYILAIGQYGSEYFYDAANATGSPLARIDGSVLPFGTTMPDTIASNRTATILVANTSDGEMVIMSIEGRQYKQIEAQQMLKVFSSDILRTITGAQQGRGMFYRFGGELCYCLQANGETLASANPTTKTWVLSLETGIWSQFTGRASATTTFPIQASVAGGPTQFPMTFVAGVTGSNVYVGYFSLTSDKDQMAADDDIYQEIRIPPKNFGTMNRKTMSRLGIQYQRLSDGTAPAITVAMYDGHSNTASSTHTLAGSWDNQFPFMTRLGIFRDRGFKVSTTAAGIRWETLEVDINKLQR